jgi:ribokinase
MENRSPKICVVGSINMDLVIATPNLPIPGQTILAHSLREVSGGKGANQAVAAARLGASVSMIAKVGNDAFADQLKENLIREGVSDTGIDWADGSSGTAIVAVDSHGENSILVVPGANAMLRPSDIDRHRDLIASSDVVLMQLETPVETMLRVIQVAAALGKATLLNPAPAPPSIPSGLADVDVFCPNRSEAEAILGTRIPSVPEARQAAISLCRGELGGRPKHVVITLGGDGTVAANQDDCFWIPPYKVNPVDTTAAGDAFMGGLAYQIALGVPFQEALKFASATGALATTRHGAQPSMPRLAEVLSLMRSQP